MAGGRTGEGAGKVQNVPVQSIKTTGDTERTNGIDLSAAVNPVTVEVLNSRITDFSRDGITADGLKLTANIHDNIITGPAGATGPAQVPNGIVFRDKLSGSISHNTIKSLHYNVASSWRSTGIMGFANTVQPGIVIENNDVSDVDDAINPSNDFILRTNILHGNGSGVVLGMGAARNQITNNTITCNFLDGIKITGASNATLDGRHHSSRGNYQSSNRTYDNY